MHRDKKTWIFVYRLKPKHTNVDSIYDIKLVYFDPSSGDKNKFVTKYRGIDKITVTPRPDKTNIIAIEPLAVPASFYESVEPQYVLAGGPASLAFSTWQIVLFLAAPLFGCVVGVLVWRRYFPNETEAARRYRLQSAARALAQLPADGVPAWVVVHRYLQDRFRYPVKDPTPAEVASFLKRHGFAKPLCEQARTFFRECDAANFAGPVAEPKQLAADARRLIQALEADPCARRDCLPSFLCASRRRMGKPTRKSVLRRKPRFGKGSNTRRSFLKHASTFRRRRMPTLSCIGARRGPLPVRQSWQCRRPRESLARSNLGLSHGIAARPNDRMGAIISRSPAPRCSIRPPIRAGSTRRFGQPGCIALRSTNYHG